VVKRLLIFSHATNVARIPRTGPVAGGIEVLMSYSLRELHSAIWAPFLPWLQATASFLTPTGDAPYATPASRFAARCNLLVRLCKRYAKPEFCLTDTVVDMAADRTEAAGAHRRFYDESNAVLALAADYYLETIRVAFQAFRLARGTWQVHGEPVRPQDLRNTTLISGRRTGRYPRAGPDPRGVRPAHGARRLAQTPDDCRSLRTLQRFLWERLAHRGLPATSRAGRSTAIARSG
jgi:hypothetical protein